MKNIRITLRIEENTARTACETPNSEGSSSRPDLETDSDQTEVTRYLITRKSAFDSKGASTEVSVWAYEDPNQYRFSGYGVGGLVQIRVEDHPLIEFEVPDLDQLPIIAGLMEVTCNTEEALNKMGLL